MTAKDAVLAVLFEDPMGSFTMRELGRRAGVSIRSVILAIRVLKDEGLVRVVKKGNAKLVSASRTDNFRSEKENYNLKLLKASGLVEHISKLAPEAVVLFGSFARGEDTPESDIDIAVIGGLDEKLEGLGTFEKKIGRKISIHRVKDTARETAEFKNTLANGKVLKGYLKLAY